MRSRGERRARDRRQSSAAAVAWLQADPPPTVRWQHAGVPIAPSARATINLENKGGSVYHATLVIKVRRAASRRFAPHAALQEPSAGDGGAYKAQASNQFGESNANINLNFAGVSIVVESLIANWCCRQRRARGDAKPKRPHFCRSNSSVCGGGKQSFRSKPKSAAAFTRAADACFLLVAAAP